MREVDVYVDILFLINFSMDYLGLYLSTTFLRRKKRWWRMIAASCIGGIYSVAVLFLEMGRYTEFAVNIAVCVLMCIVCDFSLSDEKKSIHGIVFCFTYVVISMVIGGVMTALYNIFNRFPLPLSKEAGEGGVPLYAFVLLAIASAAVGFLIDYIVKRSAARKKCEIEFAVGSERRRIRAICDSGNFLRDPISGSAVIVIDRDVMASILCESAAKKLIEKDIPGACICAEEENICFHVRLIPMRTASGGGMMLGLVPDELKLIIDGRESFPDALIAAGEKLDISDGSAGIVPSEIII